MPVRLTREERRAQTRAELLEAAARVFVERGFERSSIEAITEEAGYTRGAFYSNFKSKEELFAELLQQRAYSQYTEMAKHPPRTLRETGEQLAAIQEAESGQWLFRLWLELLAAAGRDSEFRKIAAGFWSTNRKLTAATLEASYQAAGAKPPAPPEDLASAMIAMDIGLALQHFVDPEAAPLKLYPELYELVFSHLSP
jgi:AcrR family transcriptional regulator